ncbi:DUF742 domain-containing protein [Nocardiopsis trehalosi]|uniref:DUF742 domain-containing protein n=1 Tax=Nocardiopsis trehalosi TaxID=109329 RepID=UPI000835F437|nr:DUF742 domain-containing protein [Nocardiopsis trehalosi]
MNGPDDPAGRLVRPFAVRLERPGGAARPDLLTRVAATRPPCRSDTLHPERATVLRLARRPQTVAELAAHLDLPLSVVKLLVADMLAAGALRTCRPPRALDDGTVLRLLLDGLRAL